MKATPLFISTLCSGLLFFAGCKKKTETESLFPEAKENTVLPSKSDLKSFFKAAAAKPETFRLNAQTGGSFTSSRGTVYTVAPNAFIKANGTTVSGVVDITVLEVTAPSEMLLNDKPTNALLEDKKDTLAPPKGAMLESFGEFKVDAKQQNEVLELKSTAKIEVEAPVPPQIPPAVIPQQVPLWSGDTLMEKSSRGHDHENQEVFLSTPKPVQKGMEWKPVYQSAFVEPAVGQSAPTLSFDIPKLGEWRNCDVLITSPTPKTTTVLGYFTNVFDTASTSDSYGGEQPNMLFFKKKGTNMLVKLYNNILNAPSGKKGLLSYQNSFQVGMEGTFIALVTTNGKYYAQKKQVTIPEPENGKNYVAVSFTLQEVTKDEMLALIASMNNE